MATEPTRLETELSLLKSMYPDDQVQYQEHARELTFKSGGAGFTIRLPEEYLSSALPEVLAANTGRSDLREPFKHRVQEVRIGEEVLDSILLAFNELVASADDENKNILPINGQAEDDGGKATVIVWLHHLLNTNKRKQALSPASSDVSGVTKPGYPGVLVYSGPSKAVHEHVHALKKLNWQAFQVRFESDDDEEWKFAHGSGVTEVEAMKDVVAEIGKTQKEAFMEAMRMK